MSPKRRPRPGPLFAAAVIRKILISDRTLWRFSEEPVALGGE
jgi:hypothetical protein